MFPQFKKKLNDESGIVLYIVLMTAIIIMIFSVGILTQSMNETNYAQQQIDQIVSDQLARGVYWNAYASSFAAGHVTTIVPPAASSFTLQGRTYQVNLTPQGASPASSGCGAPCSQWSVTANYDTLN